ncbi:MAG: TPM domain-containing protein [Gammaproteobacteria bacterium]|nr:TPM domain-containing protein [Gammaproteobacteria bacterium]
MAFLTDSEKDQLRAVIRQAEARTAGEIVTVIARASGDYYYYPTLWAALAAILAPLPFEWFAVSFAPLGVIELQLLTFMLLGLLLRVPAIKLRLVPRAVQRAYCARRAREQFLAQNLHTTRERTGVLLYVSVAEHHIELLADAGIHARVPAGTWDTIVAEFTAQLRAGRIGAGFCTAVQTVGEHLAGHFPADAANPNELPDHLIEI